MHSRGAPESYRLAHEEYMQEIDINTISDKMRQCVQVKRNLPTSGPSNRDSAKLLDMHDRW